MSYDGWKSDDSKYQDRVSMWDLVEDPLDKECPICGSLDVFVPEATFDASLCCGACGERFPTRCPRCDHDHVAYFDEGRYECGECELRFRLGEKGD